MRVARVGLSQNETKPPDLRQSTRKQMVKTMLVAMEITISREGEAVVAGNIRICVHEFLLLFFVVVVVVVVVFALLITIEKLRLSDVEKYSKI